MVLCSVVLAACGSSSSTSSGARTTGGVLQVVAAENFWGSIASQIGGTHVRVVSIITNPDTDPHDYEPTATDARTLASAVPLLGVTEVTAGPGGGLIVMGAETVTQGVLLVFFTAV